MKNIDEIVSSVHEYSLPINYIPSYGTAGFRTHHANLHSTMYRCGILMACRALQQNKATGIMITASHNPEEDNGVKLIDTNGDMLNTKWEQYVNSLCSSSSYNELKNILGKIWQNDGLVINNKSKVMLGRDTRQSSEKLMDIVKSALVSMNVEFLDYGLVTTPQLHYNVRLVNTCNISDSEHYFINITNSFKELYDTHCDISPLYIDCANGVGAIVLQRLLHRLPYFKHRFVLLNTGEGQVNFKCGSDYVQKSKTFPANFDDVPEGARCCSLDGDGDRLVYFTKKNDKCVLLDGDRLAVVYALYIKKLLSGIEPSTYTMSIIQTAYANGNSTKYIEDVMKIKTRCTPTGVKHLHHAAKDYDIGIYFEANGHGTVLFKNEFITNHSSHKELLAVYALMNQNVGDGITCIFLAEAIFSQGNRIDDYLALYKDLPSKQLQLCVRDKNEVETTDAERTCVCPFGLQEHLNGITSMYENSRTFIRPSGTENLVRIYVETRCEDDLEALK